MKTLEEQGCVPIFGSGTQIDSIERVGNLVLAFPCVANCKALAVGHYPNKAWTAYSLNVYNNSAATTLAALSVNNTSGKFYLYGNLLLEWDPTIMLIYWGVLTASTSLFTAAALTTRFVGAGRPLESTAVMSAHTAHLYGSINEDRTCVNAWPANAMRQLIILSISV